jgi:hypothetical protein
MNCERIHGLFNGFGRYGFPFEGQNIPCDGIYILFEKGEIAHNSDRIVRVGTHTGKGNLKQRLMEHFCVENKDRSIFRKNIGRALLSRRNDSFLSQWDIDLTSKQERLRSAGKVDLQKLLLVEKEVTCTIREMFTFCLLPVESKQYRLELEKRIIATVNHCQDCCPSSNWLGRFSPKGPVRNSGLWLIQGLNGPEVRKEDLDFIEQRR